MLVFQGFFGIIKIFEIKNAAEKLNSDAMNVNVYIVIISKFIVAIILCRLYIRKNT